MHSAGAPLKCASSGLVSREILSRRERNASIRKQLAYFSQRNFQVPEAELDAFLRKLSALNP